MLEGNFEGDWQSRSLPSLAVAAHELKSPIALMRQLSLLLDDASLTEVERQEFQSQLIGVADRALNLVTDLSQSANLQPSLFPLEPLSPLAIYRSLADETRVMCRVYDRRISWAKPQRQSVVVANRHLLKRIILGFIDNAMKYTDANLPVRVSTRRIGDCVRFSVRDHGPAMNLVDYRRLLSEKATLKTVKTRPEGSGLGIFLANQFAESMDSQIGLVRHKDGLTFFVDVPISRQMSLL